jgi:hypothetical protein
VKEKKAPSGHSGGVGREDGYDQEQSGGLLPAWGAKSDLDFEGGLKEERSALPGSGRTLNG